jgi:hypothetical protein
MNSRMVKLNFHIDGHLVETRRLAMVEMEPGERVRDAIQTGAQVYGGGLLYAFVRAIPAGAQEFVELETETGLVTLVHAPWVPVGAVMVGRGGQAVREPIYTGVKNYMDVVDG